MICSLLFHFNSLATFGFGTALGVIRALHVDEVLERAYCTETRPFNQVNNLHYYMEIWNSSLVVCAP